MVPLLADMVSATKRSSAQQITFVPVRFLAEGYVQILSLRLSTLLSFAFGDARERRKRTAKSIALVSATGTKSCAWLVAEDF